MCKIKYKKTGWYIPGSWVPVRERVSIQRCPSIPFTTVPLTKVTTMTSKLPTSKLPTLEPESIVLALEHKKQGSLRHRQEAPESELWSDEDCIDYFKKAWSVNHRSEDIDFPISLLCYNGLGELNGH